MNGLFCFPDASGHDFEVERWLQEQPGEVGILVRRWFQVLRDCADDVRELMHDGHPTACVGDAAFAYVAAYTAHVNVGFFRGAELEDPDDLLEGNGRYMRHVRLQPDKAFDNAALEALIRVAYSDMRERRRQVPVETTAPTG